MNVKEALLSRRSVRAFKPDPIEKETILSILKDAFAHTLMGKFTALGGVCSLR